MGQNWTEQDLLDLERRGVRVLSRQLPAYPPPDSQHNLQPAVRVRTVTTAGATTPGGEGVESSPQPIKRPEQALQIQVAAFLDLALPPPLRFLHIPNGERRSPIIGAILKAMGVKKGAADVLILGWSPFVWIELKAGEGRLSADQKDWRDWCRLIGAPWFVCRSLDDVIEALTSLGILLLARAA